MSIFIGKTFDRQIQQDAQAFKEGIADTRDGLIEDIREKVKPETEDWRVPDAIENDDSNPPSLAENVLEILEYGNKEGLIIASKGDSDARRGVKDLEALNRAREAQKRTQRLNPQAAIRLRTSEKRVTIEVTLPIEARGEFKGFVTGGYFLRERLNQTLKDEGLHPVFLREDDRLVALNDPGNTILRGAHESILALSRFTGAGFPKMDLIGIPHYISGISISTSNIDTPAELIIAYSHRDVIESRRQLMFILLITGGIVLVFVYLVSYVIGLQTTKPIQQLAAGATEIALGNLDHRVAIQSRDEIGGLAGAFNGMAADLKTTLEKRLAAERIAAWQDVARRVAHEIKNPLFPIRLSVENLQRAYQSKSHFSESSAKPEPAIFDEIFDECTETVIEEVERLQRMVDEFHQFARMPAPARKPSNLNQIAQHVLNLYAESAAQVQIETDLDLKLPLVSVDSEQITQALGNLIKNATEAMSGGGTLKISTQLADGKKIQIEIQDTGIGMSAETQAKIFTPYYTTKEAGTGLGMSIVQRIITDHDGGLFVESAEGVGTTVRIELPVPA